MFASDALMAHGELPVLALALVILARTRARGVVPLGAMALAVLCLELARFELGPPPEKIDFRWIDWVDAMFARFTGGVALIVAGGAVGLARAEWRALGAGIFVILGMALITAVLLPFRAVPPVDPRFQCMRDDTFAITNQAIDMSMAILAAGYLAALRFTLGWVFGDPRPRESPPATF